MFGVGIYKNSNIFQVVNKLNPQYFLENSYPPYVKCYLYIDEKNSHTHRQRHKYCVYVTNNTCTHVPTYIHTYICVYLYQVLENITAGIINNVSIVIH